MSIYLVKVKFETEKYIQTYVVNKATSPSDAINVIYEELGGVGTDFEIKSVSDTKFVAVYESNSEDDDNGTV